MKKYNNCFVIEFRAEIGKCTFSKHTYYTLYKLVYQPYIWRTSRTPGTQRNWWTPRGPSCGAAGSPRPERGSKCNFLYFRGTYCAYCATLGIQLFSPSVNCCDRQVDEAFIAHNDAIFRHLILFLMEFPPFSLPSFSFFPTSVPCITLKFGSI